MRATIWSLVLVLGCTDGSDKDPVDTDTGEIPEDTFDTDTDDPVSDSDTDGDTDGDTDLPTLQGDVVVAPGGTHTCARRTDGSAWSMGANTSGQLGDGSFSASTSPVQVLSTGDVPLADVAQVAAGASHSCALTGSRQVYCWGNDASGALGNGAGGSSQTAGPVTTDGGAPLENIATIAVSSRTNCGIKLDGELWCWGENLEGQVGVGDTSAKGAAVHVDDGGTLGPVLQVALSEGHTCALIDDGTVQCWGRNADGQLGNGSNAPSTTPVAVETAPGTPLTGAVAIGVGSNHSCAVLEAGELWCWGSASADQLGDGAGANANRPVQAKADATTPIDDAIEVVGTAESTCVRFTDDRVECFGSEANGVLGNGADGPSSEPYPVSVETAPGTPLANIARLRAGPGGVCAVRRNDTAVCWGLQAFGQFGTGTMDPALRAVTYPL